MKYFLIVKFIRYEGATVEECEKNSPMVKEFTTLEEMNEAIKIVEQDPTKDVRLISAIKGEKLTIESVYEDRPILIGQEVVENEG